jgi:hypothetical protein
MVSPEPHVLEREQSKEEMAVCGGSHGMAPNSGGRWGAGPSFVGRRRNRVSSERLSQVRHAFASAQRDVVGRRLRRSESQGLDTNPAWRDNVRGEPPPISTTDGTPSTILALASFLYRRRSGSPCAAGPLGERCAPGRGPLPFA